MPLFGKKPEKQAPPIPLRERLKQLRDQGLSDEQIIDALQTEGYAPNEIYEALRQEAVIPALPPAPPTPEPAEKEEGVPFPAPTPAAAPGPPAAPSAVPTEQIEEIAEAIIDERWNELMKDLEKLAAWRESIETKMTKLEQQFKDLKESFETLEKGVLGKVEEYEKSIKDVSTDIKAMEEVFKKIMPTFTENVNELARLVKAARARKKA